MEIKGITPISDWEVAAYKWTLNADKHEMNRQEQSQLQQNDLKSQYTKFRAGQNILNK